MMNLLPLGRKWKRAIAEVRTFRNKVGILLMHTIDLYYIYTYYIGIYLFIYLTRVQKYTSH